ncbi:MAG: Holliday junction branch migration protein RuvA [Clostridia bacterium]|nr:Holliday junction branch migration protein RuvA [Clostridia bacterium]
MLEYIKGYIEHIDIDYIVVESHDIGYKIMTSTTTISDVMHEGEKVCIYTDLIVREDSMTLCGFSTRNELKMFQLLTSVSGVGTKVGIAILSSIPYTSLYTILIEGNVNALTSANGVGKKTAERIILELKEKVKKVMHIQVDHGEIIQETFDMNHTNLEDAKAALSSLGYSQNEIQLAVSNIDATNLSVEDIIKLALKDLMNR